MDLVIMSAGFGKRFGTGIKQLEPIGPNGETIMELSVRDAKEAGFEKVIFIIRKDIEDLFKETVLSKVKEKGISVEYVVQDMNDDIKGTVCAVLSAKDNIQNDFAVINADDYYGKNAFKQVMANKDKIPFMLGYYLKNTLSDTGAVTRGVCKVDSNNILKSIDEVKGITTDTEISKDSLVSMNLWVFPKEILARMDNYYSLAKQVDYKGELLIPIFVQDELEEGKTVYVVPTDSEWIGITYEEDVRQAREKMRKIRC